MRVKRLLEILEKVDPEARIIVQYPEHRCQSSHGRMPGIAVIDDVDISFDVPRRIGGGYIDGGTPDNEVYTETEVRFRILRDDLP